MKHFKSGFQVMGALALAVGCGPSDETLAQQQHAVVYGTDNRMDVHAHPDATLRARAQQAAVALVHPGFIDLTDPNHVTFPGPTLGAGLNLCSTERFWSDPRAAFCSGTLIDDDLVLTAGHCVGNAAECADTYFVFNFHRTGEGVLHPVTSQDVFTCGAIVARQLGTVNGQNLDYAVVRLDRAATPRFTPAPVRMGNTALGAVQNVAVVGGSSGTPIKIDTGGSVRDARSGTLDYFVSNSDTFPGTSGAAVYETAQHTLAGILVRGYGVDYVDNGGCNVVNVCPETGCTGSESTYVYPALKGVCTELQNNSTRLCTGMPPAPVRPASAFGYTTSDTYDATQNTVDRTYTLGVGDVIQANACGLPDFPATGYPKLRLEDAQGNEVASSFDGCGFKLRTGAAGTYTLRAGCDYTDSCSATVDVKVTLNANLKRGTLPFNLVNTSSGTRKTANLNVTLTPGQVLDVGTCGVECANATGDTLMRLHDASGTVVAENDDAFGTCGSLSRIVYQMNVVAPSVKYQVRVGCFQNTRCSGTAAYVIY
ncbi:trypsin-like peptidase domain-containing protein [Corallococcus macrosporus]|uniref:Trypsin-like peptidase domain-containing protein n=1 Tax=Corallococcus macrosporus TaxID=35 RepID=A0ABS3DHZ2_9BACT|nr:serine protease [Corallococcus macrosporus]MBN8230903.1 trypsin-like peptidase domain-containing protein [Corallococcus macrosporus]